MTEKAVYENVLTELRKVKAPSLHLEDFNYWASKGVQEYANERYNQFAKTQQLSDDLSALTVSTTLLLTPTITLSGVTYTGQYTGQYVQPIVNISTGKQYGSDYIRFNSPDNYWHFLGSTVTSKLFKAFKCFPAGYEENRTSKRLVGDVGNGIVNNSYLKPSFDRPYHSFIANSLGGVNPDLIYFTGDIKKFGVSSIFIDYLKEPRKINLTVSQRDLPVDTSAVMEFPEYVCMEIIKRIVQLILEASSDPRIQINPAINKTIP